MAQLATVFQFHSYYFKALEAQISLVAWQNSSAMFQMGVICVYMRVDVFVYMPTHTHTHIVTLKITVVTSSINEM